MNNKDAREILDHNWTKLVNPDYSDEELGEAQNLAIKALSIEPQEWISIKDRLPETIGKEVLISGRRGGNGEPFIRVAKFCYDDYYDEPKFEGDEGENYFCDAWRELPSPYKGEDVI